MQSFKEDEAKEFSELSVDPNPNTNIPKDVIEDEFDDDSGLLKAHHDGNRYNLILLDVQMKKLDGFDAAELIRELDKDVIIVFITTRAEYLSKALFVEASAYLVKPVKHEDVLNVLTHATKRWKTNEKN